VPKGPQGQNGPPAPLFMVLMALIIMIVPLNIYITLRHPGESPFWVAAAFISSILSFVGLGLFIWSRYAKRP
jgi:hypothetical protein